MSVRLSRRDRPDDVRMVERARQLRLAEEAPAEALVAREGKAVRVRAALPLRLIEELPSAGALPIEL